MGLGNCEDWFNKNLNLPLILRPSNSASFKFWIATSASSLLKRKKKFLRITEFLCLINVQKK
jgi:hypothetical protein